MLPFLGKQDKRYDIPISEIQQVGANVLIGQDLATMNVNTV
jgi:sporulation protein YlmC with PRC-barrel domain